MIQSLIRRLLTIKGLGTVPGLIAMALWALSFVTLYVDSQFPEFSNSEPFRFFYTDYETARSVLSTVAAAAITTLGLVYSIVLVVFTTAAGNIGPRLLQRFTGDNVNQFTAGLFGGTFLFALTILHQTDSGFVPSVSIAATFLLAALAVLQLIYFVHSASRSVTIDEEVAEIATQLEAEIELLIAKEDIERFDGSKLPQPDDTAPTIYANRTGYISVILEDKLRELAEKKNLFVLLVHEKGDFIVEGQKLARIVGDITEDDREEFEEKLGQIVGVARSRSPDTDIEFAVNLLIEIALRALSPGVNDTYTAVACIDRLSSALAKPVERGLKDQVLSDDKGEPRAYIPGLTIENLINASFHPFRRASSGNVLMSKHILQALGRLTEIASVDARAVLNDHADLVIKGCAKAELLKSDLDFLKSLRKKLLVK